MTCKFYSQMYSFNQFREFVCILDTEADVVATGLELDLDNIVSRISTMFPSFWHVPALMHTANRVCF